MKKEIKQKWIEALKSGDYKKGGGQLYKPLENTYCCLGVLGAICDIKIDVSGEMFTIDKKRERNSEAITTTYPELILNEGLKLTDSMQTALYRINDGADTFEPVILYIEQKVEEEE